MSTKFYFWGDDDSLHEVEDVGRFSLLLGSDTYDRINMERAQIRESVSGQSTSPQTEECGADHICNNTRCDSSTQKDEDKDISHHQIVKMILDDTIDDVTSRVVKNDTRTEPDEQHQIERNLLIPIPRFTNVDKSLHSALHWSEDTVDRLTHENNKNRVMTREQHKDLVSSIEKIHGYLQETITSDKREDNLEGLDKLFNGGHISIQQQRLYIQLKLGR